MSCLILGGIILLANACSQTVPSERDSISFKAPVKAVEDSIRRMNTLMDKLKPIEGEMINYFFDNEGYFYLNSQKIGKIKDINIDTVGIVKNFTPEEKKEFVSLIIFLNNNYISSAFKDRPCKCYLYDYKAVDDKSFNMKRNIYLSEKGKSYETLFAERETLDKKGNLILIGTK